MGFKTYVLHNKVMKIGNAKEIKKVTGELKPDFKEYNTNVIEKFKEFAESHKEYSKQDLYSMALYEFMEKYKK